MPIAQTARWAATHGLFHLAVVTAARSGNPDALILRDPRQERDRTGLFTQLRAGDPFVPGTFCPTTARQAAVSAVLRSEDFGSPDPTQSLPRPVQRLLALAGPSPYPGPAEPPSMLVVDDPDHARYRTLVSRAFTARAIAHLRSRTEQVATELLDDIERTDTGGSFDLVGRYASQLPVRVISEMLGIPDEMRADLLSWGDGAALSLEMGVSRRSFVRLEHDLAAFNGWMTGHLARLRREPGDDVLSKMLQGADEGGGRLTDRELTATALLLLGAGFETTVNLIGTGTAALFEHPEQRALLAAEPQRWANAVEEMLRFDPPVQRTARRAVRTTTVFGATVPAGQTVVLNLAGANRDPDVFTDPDRFDVTRTNAREHLSFSAGPHFCLGAALARMEAEVGLRSLFARWPDLGPAGPGRRKNTRILQGFAALPVTRGVRATPTGLARAAAPA